MTKFERINAPRVEKIQKMLEVIQTSAKSNRASPEEVSALLTPLHFRSTPTQQPAPQRAPNERVPLMDQIREAPLNQVMKMIDLGWLRISEELEKS